MELVEKEIEVDIEDNESLDVVPTYSLRERLANKNFLLVIFILLFQLFATLMFALYLFENKY